MFHCAFTRRRRGIVVAVAVLTAVSGGSVVLASGDPPEAFASFAFGNQDVPTTVFLSASDPDGDPLTFEIVTQPAHGLIDGCDAFGMCVYTPVSGFAGTDSGTFRVSDGDLTSNVATIDITVLPQLPPNAFGALVTTKRGVPISFGLQADDPNSDPLSFAVTTGPLHGSLVGCETSQCVYTPDAGFSGADSFEFVASDAFSSSDPATVSIDVLATAMTVDPLNDVSEAADLAVLLAGPGVTISNVSLTGASEAAGSFDGGSAGVGVAQGVVLSTGSATAVVGPNIGGGTTGNLQRDGDDALTALSGVQTYDATILEFDLVPTSSQLTFDYVFGSEEYNEYVNSQYNDVFAFFVNGVNCAVVDGDPVTINTVNNGNPIGTTPNSNPQYYINNELGGGPAPRDTELDGMTVVLTCVAAVDIGVPNHVRLAIADGSDSALDSAVFLARGSFQANTAPVANPQSLTTPASTAIPVTLTGSDAEGDDLTFQIGSDPAHGTLTGTAPDLSYTPDPGFTGTDTFTFVATDGALTSEPAAVNILVTGGPNTPPSANDQTVSTTQDVAVPIALSASDPDGDALSYSVTSGPSHGTLTGSAPALTYTPDPGYFGPDSFAFVVHDGTASSNTATVSISVTPTNQPPSVDAGGDGAGVEGAPATVTGVVTDPDGDPTTTTWSYAPSAGVDSGATCAFADSSAPSTTVTCTDDGTYELTLTGDDGEAAPVTDTVMLVVANADPAAVILAPANGSTVSVGATVQLSAEIADAGSNDNHTCTIDWGDGSVNDGVVSAGVCAGSHVYSSLFATTIVVHVVDDDGGAGTASIDLLVSSATANVTGGGWYETAGGRVSVGLVAEQLVDGPVGQIQIRLHNTDRFHGYRVDSIVVDGNMATLTGEGRWNGTDGYSFVVVVSDSGNGKKATAPDTISIHIEDPDHQVVLTTGGNLSGGNLRVRR